MDSGVLIHKFGLFEQNLERKGGSCFFTLKLILGFESNLAAKLLSNLLADEETVARSMCKIFTKLWLVSKYGENS